MQSRVGQTTAQRRDHRCLRIALGTFVPSPAPDFFCRYLDPVGDGLEPRGHRAGERPDPLLVVLGIEPAASVPRRNDRARRVLIQKEADQSIRSETASETKVPAVPPATCVGVGGDTVRVIGGAGNQTQHAERLQVAGQRRRRTSVQPDRVNPHSAPPPPRPMRASPRCAAMLPGMRAETARAAPAGCAYARSNWLPTGHPCPVP